MNSNGSILDERSYTFRDKSLWPVGPWVNEPDKLQWVDIETDLDCLIVRGPSGALCGYVGVAEGHPFFGVDYTECVIKCGQLYCAHTTEDLLDVHGRITYSNFCQEDEKEIGICHIPYSGRPAHIWWLGFDTCHYGDLLPNHSHLLWTVNGVYRDIAYVRDQCHKLAVQLREFAELDKLLEAANAQEDR